MGRRVLIAVDGSSPSTCATNWALENLITKTDETYILYVAPHPDFQYTYLGNYPRALFARIHFILDGMGMGYGTVYPPNFFETIRRRAELEAEKIRRRYARICLNHGVKPEVVIAEGSPREEICKVIEERGIGCLVIASRGHGALKR
jgi:nucleotide-binding universal stress UspA family protein